MWVKTMTDGITIAGVEYCCRICERRQVVYVSPIHHDDRPTVDYACNHRTVVFECPDCEQRRTMVAVPTLPDRFHRGEADA